MNKIRRRSTMSSNGCLVISLDFELYWGMCDHVPLKDYEDNLLGARTAIPKMLALFQEFGIRATWATVGNLMCQDFQQLRQMAPGLKPSYDETALSPYSMIDSLPDNGDESSHPCYLARSLVQQILNSPGQELATHTFCHYYCRESGQTGPQFAADLAAAKACFEWFNVPMDSIVFPRNQWAYLKECEAAGLICYRGTPPHWLYNAPTWNQLNHPLRRIVRLMDAYLPVSGDLLFDLPSPSAALVNVPASRELRPVPSHRLGKLLEPLRLSRVTQSLTNAAKQGKGYHLWWHPHNYGLQTDENLLFMRKILEHFRALQSQYGFVSRSMQDLALEIRGSQ